MQVEWPLDVQVQGQWPLDSCKRVAVGARRRNGREQKEDVGNDRWNIHGLFAAVAARIKKGMLL